MDPNQRAIDYIRDTAEFVETADGDTISASQMMEKFLFTEKCSTPYIGKLSGGSAGGCIS